MLILDEGRLIELDKREGDKLLMDNGAEVVFDHDAPLYTGASVDAAPRYNTVEVPAAGTCPVPASKARYVIC